MLELLIGVALGLGAWILLKRYQNKKGLGGQSLMSALRSAPAEAPDIYDGEPRPDPVEELQYLPRRLYIEYRTRKGGLSKREVDAEELQDLGGELYLTGYCHLKKEERSFRVDRIAAFTDRHSNAAFRGKEAQAALVAAARARGVIQEPDESLTEAQARAAEAFQEWAGRDDWLLMAVSASGHDKRAEVLEVVVLSAKGETRLQKQVLPQGRISEAASARHGLTAEALRGAPIWPRLHNEVTELLASAPYVLSYNALFQLRLLEQTAELFGKELPELEFDCVMLAYAALRAEPGQHGQAKWHALTDAAAHEGLAADEAEGRGALAEARTTWRLIQKLGGGTLSEPWAGGAEAGANDAGR